MRLRILAVLALGCSLAYARNIPAHQSGTILRMDSVECGSDVNSGKTFAGELIGTDSAHKRTRDLLCQQYVLQTERIVYTIRPRDEKHPQLLPIGVNAQFRLDKDKLKLRMEDLDDKEREYVVVSMTPVENRELGTARDSRPLK